MQVAVDKSEMHECKCLNQIMTFGVFVRQRVTGVMSRLHGCLEEERMGFCCAGTSLL